VISATEQPFIVRPLPGFGDSAPAIARLLVRWMLDRTDQGNALRAPRDTLFA